VPSLYAACGVSWREPVLLAFYFLAEFIDARVQATCRVSHCSSTILRAPDQVRGDERKLILRVRVLRPLALTLTLLLCCVVAFAQAAPAGAPHQTVVFMTDFGHVDDSVPICKGVMLGIAPDVRIVDLTHDVTPFNILEAARYLAGTTPYYAPGTVFVVVVDPGVGSTRRAIVAHSKRGQWFVLPDNGVLTLVADQDGIDAAYDIQNPAWMIGSALSSTFHGRDIFSPVGAHIARGDDVSQVGPALDVKSLVRLSVQKATVDEHGISATVIGTDGPFGNLVTNITREDFAKLGYSLGDSVRFTLAGKPMQIPFVKTFSDVAVGRPLFYIDSRGRLGLAINQGSFVKRYIVKVPATLDIQKKAQVR
jgi:S-adenosylmethionine hydrolase